MKNYKEFCVFILTHGRPNNVITYNTLRKQGYTGDIYFILDNEDKTINQYIENYGSQYIKIFDKKYYADNIDEGNNFHDRRTITHARNSCFDIAEKLGYIYFIQLDDDYTKFDYRIDLGYKIIDKKYLINNLDFIFNQLLEFYKSINALSISFAQGGDFIGGINNGKSSYRFSKRKCMNSFLCSINRKFNFIGAFNEDVNTYTTLGSRGNLFFTIPVISLTQKQTQSNKSGITDLYLKYGTYVKSFTTTMMHPSSVKVSMMNSDYKRIHHTINWKNTTPMIIDEKYKKTNSI